MRNWLYSDKRDNRGNVVRLTSSAGVMIKSLRRHSYQTAYRRSLIPYNFSTILMNISWSYFFIRFAFLDICIYQFLFQVENSNNETKFKPVWWPNRWVWHECLVLVSLLKWNIHISMSTRRKKLYLLQYKQDILSINRKNALLVET